MERFSYKGGCGVRDVDVSRHLKEELAWVINKQLRVISNKSSYTTKKLKNKAFLNLKQYKAGGTAQAAQALAWALFMHL